MTNPGGGSSNAAIAAVDQTNAKTVSAISDANAARAGAQSLQSQLSYNDTDNPYINDLENWAGKSHQEIYSGAQSLMPGMLQTYATHWNDIATNLGGGLFGSNLAVQNALAAGAKGQIANAATDAARTFFQQLTEVQDVITAVSARIRTVADGAQAVKLSVPPPSNTTSAPAVPMTPGTAQAGAALGITTAANAMTQGRSEDELHQTAIAAMKNNYDPVFAPAGTGVPTFVSISKPGSQGPGPSSGPSSTANSNANSASNNTQNANNSQQKDSQQKDPSSSDQSSQQSPSSANQGTSSSNTTPQSADSSSFNPSTSTGTAGYNGGTGGGGGLGGLDSGTSSGGSGAAGQSIPGTGNGNAAAAAASTNAAAKTTSSGTSGMPGMGGAGARKSEDEEREHKTPDYLIMDREEELIGRLDPASGGALGANFPAAQTQRDNGEGNYR